jgi:hypothetical protein
MGVLRLSHTVRIFRRRRWLFSMWAQARCGFDLVVSCIMVLWCVVLLPSVLFFGRSCCGIGVGIFCIQTQTMLIWLFCV